MPSPITSASRIAPASPVPAHPVVGLEGATASAPIACTGMLSDTGRNVDPLSDDFQTPPDAEPTYHVRASPGTPVMAENRPPPDGPKSWNRNGSGTGRRAAGCGAAAPRGCAATDCKAMSASMAARTGAFIDGDLEAYGTWRNCADTRVKSRSARRMRRCPLAASPAMLLCLNAILDHHARRHRRRAWTLVRLLYRLRDQDATPARGRTNTVGRVRGRARDATRPRHRQGSPPGWYDRARRRRQLHLRAARYVVAPRGAWPA